MKQITRELIDNVLLEVTKDVADNLTQNYVEFIQQLPEEQLDNPIARECASASFAIGKSTSIFKEVLYKLLAEDIEE